MAFAPEFSLVGRAVEIDQDLVDFSLPEGILFQQCGSDNRVDVFDRPEHPFASEAALIVVTKLDGFIGAGGCARRHGCPAACASFQDHFRFQGRVSA